jgi:hypothetical protein
MLFSGQNDGAAEAMGKFAQDRGINRGYLMAPNYLVRKAIFRPVSSASVGARSPATSTPR